MANANDIAFLAAAEEILNEFGVQATLSKRGDATFDPATGVVSEVEVDTVVEKVSPPINYSAKEAMDSSILSDDFKVVVKRSDTITAVDRFDYITINGIKASVISTKPIYSGEEIAVWILQCRKGVSDLSA